MSQDDDELLAGVQMDVFAWQMQTSSEIIKEGELTDNGLGHPANGGRIMNTLLVDALVDAILALSPEEQRLVQEKLQIHKGGAEVHPTEQIQMGREERIRQQDEFLQTLFPTYTPPQVTL